MTYAQDDAAIVKPFGQLLKDSYAKMSLATYMETKWTDVTNLFYGGEVAGLESGDFRQALTVYETGTFFHLFMSLGLVNLGFLCRFFAKRTTAVRFADRCLWMIVGSVLLWMFALYQPNATWIHQWSLANVLILYVILTIYIVDGRPALVYPLLALQTLFIFPLFVFSKPLIEQIPGVVFDAPLDLGMACIALLAFLGLAYVGWRVKLQEVS
jgi:hypothetical protein